MLQLRRLRAPQQTLQKTWQIPKPGERQRPTQGSVSTKGALPSTAPTLPRRRIYMMGVLQHQPLPSLIPDRDSSPVHIRPCIEVCGKGFSTLRFCESASDGKCRLGPPASRLCSPHHCTLHRAGAPEAAHVLENPVHAPEEPTSRRLTSTFLRSKGGNRLSLRHF